MAKVLLGEFLLDHASDQSTFWEQLVKTAIIEIPGKLKGDLDVGISNSVLREKGCKVGSIEGRLKVRKMDLL